MGAKSSVYNCHNPKFFKFSLCYFGNGIAKIRNFLFSLLSPISALVLQQFKFFSLLFQLVDQLGSRARAQKLGNNNFSNGIVLPKFIFLSPPFGQIISLPSLLLFVTILVTPLPKFTSLLTQLNNFEQYTYYK